ncbi:integral membrane protein [Myriangium duriaei CBS 260.36]|uniref:Integral membrane protein n=1 Tax=Myriangium duriaei CBS 260.36 TaxID=1168546 RepID=A0A9P4MK26_9PEZI|nr:integral membrane protein [Myriangium duriaei CBS 260.36]
MSQFASTTELQSYHHDASQFHLTRPQSIHVRGESHSYPTIVSQELPVANDKTYEPIPTKRSVAIIFSIAMVTGVSSMLNGLTTVILPTLAKDLHLGTELQIWPISVTALTCGCTLLLAGSICDALGAKMMYLCGTVLQTAFVLGSGLSKNAFDIIMFRGLTGIAISFCLPSAVSIITSSFKGKQRNMAFAFLGSGQPVGFSIGLVLGGLLTEYVSWRVGFYIGAGIIGSNIALIVWAVPKGDAGELSWGMRRRRIVKDIDWVGAALASVSLALSSYVFAAITGSASSIKEPVNIALLSLSLVLAPVFITWVGRQENRGLPAIIPNSLWRNRYFTTVCLAVFLAWGSFNSLETMLTFYFQDVQVLSPLQTSIRFLPAAVAGIIINLIAGAMVHRVSAHLLVNLGLFVTCAAPFLMTFAKPSSSYWTSGFLANVLNPIGTDCLFTVANLLITANFPPKTQALAGGVFNTVSQVGKSVGVALTAVVASSVTTNSDFSNKSSPDALMKGYNASFWYSFGICCVTFLVALVGLKDVGKVGHKRD